MREITPFDKYIEERYKEIPSIRVSYEKVGDSWIFSSNYPARYEVKVSSFEEIKHLVMSHQSVAHKKRMRFSVRDENRKVSCSKRMAIDELMACQSRQYTARQMNHWRRIASESMTKRVKKIDARHSKPYERTW